MTARKIVIIGYGNQLRSDDGVGIWVAQALQSMELEQVKSLAVHQLTPELADILANVDLAIFIDACLTTHSTQVELELITPNSDHIITTHTGNPPALLTFTQAVYGCSPRSWWVKIPAVNVDFGHKFSAVAQAGCAIALEKISTLLKFTYAKFTTEN